MKNKILMTMILILGITSCENVLEIAPDGRKSLDEMFQNDATVGAYLNGCYQDFPKLGLQNYFWTNYRIVLSDDAWEGFGNQVGPIYAGSMTSSVSVQERDPTAGNDNSDNAGGGFWLRNWRNLRRCNVFLDRIETATVTNESDRKRWTAEAKLLRAYYNWELIKRYGPLPIITSDLGSEFDYGKLKRPTFIACVENILNDCNEALVIDELPWRITADAEKTRFTKAIGAAIKSQAILFAASDLFNGGNNYWAEAETITKNSLDACLANGYELYKTIRNPSLFETAYREYFCTTTDFNANPADKESILSTPYSTNQFQIVAALKMMAPNKAGLQPTQELVDAYGMQTTGQPILNLEQPYLDEKHLLPNYNSTSGYDPQNPYLGRDPRFYATVYMNGSTRKNKAGVLTTIETWYGGNNGIDPTSNKTTSTGYFPKKNDYPTNGVTGVPNVLTSYRAYRLAELYLNYAEAANENNHTDLAIAAINVIRSRAGMPDIIAAGLTKDQARLLIRNEKRVEMAYEETRYFDLRRWTKPDGDLSSTSKYVTGMWIVKNNTVPVTYAYRRCVVGDAWNDITGIWANSGKARECYTNKYLFWPIKLAEANRLFGATGENWQNPGW